MYNSISSNADRKSTDGLDKVKQDATHSSDNLPDSFHTCPCDVSNATKLDDTQLTTTVDNNFVEEATRVDELKIDNETQPTEKLDHSYYLTGKQRIWVTVGLIVTMFPAALDETIVATSMTLMASSFDSLTLAPWIATAYWMTITAFSPIFGKLADVFGLRWCILVCTSLFLVTSVLCAVAFDIIWLIVFRAISGIAAAGMLTLVLVAISKLTPPDKRSKYLGFINLNYCFTCILGPLLGGILSENLSWRWCFYINIPLCLLSLAIVYITLKGPGCTASPSGSLESATFLPDSPTTTAVAGPTTKEKLLALDYLGTGLVLAGIIALVLGIEWGGSEFAWQTPRVIILLVLGVAILLIFGWVELKVAADPIVDLRVMKVRNVSISCLTNFAMGWIINGTIYNIPLYIQLLDGAGATKAGLYLLPFLVSLNVIGLASAYFIERFGQVRLVNVLGLGLMTLGMGLYALFRHSDLGHPALVGIMIIGGAGVGFAIQNSFLPAQFQVAERDLSQATGLINFFRIIGSVFGISITGSIAKSILIAEADADHYPVSLRYLLESLNHIYQLDESLRQDFILTYIYAIGWGLFSMVGISALAFCAALGYQRCSTQKPTEK
ncbi:hypothetical protein IWQ62_004622 [Dispira parvispora]|uniref:Major facilitator superfamily (MFS) profile domain-containing protein n=1 Tax=Dispira parvispora TaxID=1520584 RepID=A0A9W8ARZ8_9FUNG|nr:hypothetical protein IWQ62_004622 [Dispira parvispora]